MGVPQRPGYQRISQSAKGNLMQIKGAEASAKLGAAAHQNTWQRWSHGQFNYRSGSRTARFFRLEGDGFELLVPFTMNDQFQNFFKKPWQAPARFPPR